MAEPNPRLDAAQRYIGAGWPVLPCIPGEKIPATRHGVLDATVDPDKVTWWWSRNPDRNVGIATGAPGPNVLDVDHHGEAGSGFKALNQLKRAGLVPEPSAIVKTPSGGMHLYYEGTEQGNGSLPRQHLDHRGAGGYVLAPPSEVGGKPYVVVKHQAEASVFDWRAARDHLEPPERQPRRQSPEPQSSAQEMDRLAGFVARQPHGNRQNGLFWAANRAVEHGLLDHAGVEALVDAAIRSGLRGGEQEARKTIQSALRSAERRPFERELEAG